ncbi:MAG: type II toxin-antitoxin system RelE/ParE family toxin [Prevotellaceae bacterium]|jgi:proteic killer suppression protein|nr:type II toxin-antitoxin system RelE/ParE family toxin [Prevotellaceae bacterium]
MEIKFSKEYLRELYESGVATDKKHRFQPDIVTRYQARIKILERASKTEDLYTLRSLCYEKLKGNKAGLESIRVNDQYRIEFKTTQAASETVVTACTILELSNHYK